MNKAWRKRLSSLVSKGWIIATALIAIVAAVPVMFANSGNAISRVNLCLARNLSSAAWLQGEAGQQVGILTIKNNGSTACRLPTRPSIVLVWHGGVLAIHQLSMPDNRSQSFGRASLSVLQPHAKADIALAWSNWCHSLLPASGPFVGSLLVSLSRSSSPLRMNMVFAEAARCDFPNEQSTLSIGRFRSPRPDMKLDPNVIVSLLMSTSASGSARVFPSGFGWALTDNGLELTTNGGSSFSAVQAPTLRLDNGDIAVNRTNVTVAGVINSSPVVGLSSDFGDTWNLVTPPAGSGNIGDVQLVTKSGTVIGMMATNVTSSNFSAGEWYATSDRGVTWTHHSIPSGGVVTAAGGDLWLAGGVQSASLYRSADLGATWSKVSIPAAAATNGAALSVPGELSNGNVVLVATTPNSDTASTFRVTVYVSSNHGASWSVLAQTSFAGQISSGVTVAASVVSNMIWLGATTGPNVVIIAANGTLATRSISGVYPGEISSISASGTSSAWVTAVNGKCPPGKTSCSDVGALLRTVNGGRTWSFVDLVPTTTPLANN